MSDRDTTRGLVTRLRSHYLGPDTAANRMPGGVFVDECGINGSTGYGRTDAPRNTRCDALYAGFTSASGRVLIGHEVKVSLTDWRSELAKAGKADAWADACHAWYVVTPLVMAEQVRLELPDGWGLMSPDPRRPTKFSVNVKARVKHQHDPPWWAIRSFMSRHDTQRAGREAKVEEELRSAIYAEFEKRAEHRAGADRRLTGTEQSRLSWLDQFERITGVDIGRANYNDIRPEHVAAGAALTQVTGHHMIAGLPEQVRRTAALLVERVADYEEAVAALTNLAVYTAPVPAEPNEETP